VVNKDVFILHDFELVQINSINVWIPNESFLQSQTLDKKIPYLGIAFAAIVDAIRQDVGNRWLNGSLLGSYRMEQEFKRQLKSMFEMGFHM